MRRIIASVRIENAASPSQHIRCDALVDVGASMMVLPATWRHRLGALEETRRACIRPADPQSAQGAVCGPVKVQVEGFRPIFTEVLFVDMTADSHGDYEPLIGSMVLDQSQAAVDMLGHRLVQIKHLDLK